MKNSILPVQTLSDSTITDIMSRDAVLWIGPGFEKSGMTNELMAKFISLPWKFIFIESTDAKFLESILSVLTDENNLIALRGHIHVVSSDPRDQSFSPRSLPIFLLNGRSNVADGPESANLKGMSAVRRRLNMLSYLERFSPKRLCVLAFNDGDFLSDVAQCWEDGYRSLLSVISTQPSIVKDFLSKWIETESFQLAVELTTSPVIDVFRELNEKVVSLLPDGRISIRARVANELREGCDITAAELPEYPILDDYDLIRTQDLQIVVPSDLKEEQFSEFFSGQHSSWIPYAAGLPWVRDVESVNEVLESLSGLEKNDEQNLKLFVLPGQSGAGVTTQLRQIAYQAAKKGYPTLLSKPQLTMPDSMSLTSFLFRSRQVIGDMLEIRSELYEPIWLLVFDVHVWRGKEDALATFLSDLDKSGRKAVCLIASGEDIPSKMISNRVAVKLQPIRHEIEMDEAVRLGLHLNNYLQYFGRKKTEAEWQNFWRNHAPNIDTPMASFWIALEFWIGGKFEISGTIQSWLIQQFEMAELSVEARLILCEIATLSLDKHVYPEALSGMQELDHIPLGIRLEQIRDVVPQLGLISARRANQYVWGFAHDLLARYLINGLANNFELRKSIGLSEAQDSTEIRLTLHKSICSRPIIGEPEFRELAEDYAINILKIDPDSGSEFMSKWREALDILSNMPDSLRQTSRTFGHHVAISKRRVATNMLFDLSVEEKEVFLRSAVDDLKFALESVVRTNGDESDLNLFNSLALAYQNLAEVRVLNSGSVEEVAALRSEAARCTNRALSIDPMNSYVLETAARNTLQTTELDVNTNSACAGSEALSYVFQAISLEHSDMRQQQLTRLANKALELMRKGSTSDTGSALSRLTGVERVLAEAWFCLLDDIDVIDSLNIESFPTTNIDNALRVIEETPSARNWLLLKLYYDLAVSQEPMGFEKQISILDELQGAGFTPPPQMELESAIILYQVGRNKEAASKFADLRRRLRDSDAYVFVPNRLRWLYVRGTSKKQVCEAIVSEDMENRSWAKVPALDNSVPFRPEEFGRRGMRSRERFSCHINFGIKGPFIRPASH
ncbi:hypothetical protein K6809_002501 [Vibrio parahaemolyticus]|nr:hypothetical protein [Vibrio parahaemolyticus]